MSFKKILVVDDDVSIQRMLRMLLRREDFEVACAGDGREALRKLENETFDLVLSDICMPDMDGLQLLNALRESDITVPIIMMSAYGTIDTAIEAMKHGAYDYINKPFKKDEVILAIRKLEERERLKQENRQLKAQLQSEYRFENIIAKSDRMLEIFQTIQKVAEFKSTVLILGESGTGKELIARAIHFNSSRRDNPFIAVNCGAIPENLLESEFFGHMRGAFTNASRTKKGLFEEADGGSLFLDEIAELPLPLQVKLLRALQESEIRRIGDTKTIKVDVRIIAATSQDLEARIQEGTFREDLFYRLNVLPIQVPPLRERKSDIPLLVNHFIAKVRRMMEDDEQGEPFKIEPAVFDRLTAYDWPGNVRELENCIERAVVLADDRTIRVENLPPAVRNVSLSEVSSSSSPLFEGLAPDELSIKRTSRYIEEQLIRRALAKTGGNRTQAAQLLEISQRALLYKIKEYGIKPEKT
ncbi:MAG: sigma-54-dependent Fis family transcriptional regulator [Deltaproteobacteria bacterium]|nr:MAG: sigma-54-dependent Fis family transcriptional regulator [Deltaproteobacteria bacterium]